MVKPSESHVPTHQNEVGLARQLVLSDQSSEQPSEQPSASDRSSSPLIIQPDVSNSSEDSIDSDSDSDSENSSETTVLPIASLRLSRSLQNSFPVADLPTPRNHPTPMLYVTTPGHSMRTPRSGLSPRSPRSGLSPREPRSYLHLDCSDSVFSPLEAIEKTYFRAVMYRASTDIPIDERGNPPPVPEDFNQSVGLFPPVATENLPFLRQNPQKVAVVVPIYNEDALELWHSLRDLSVQQAQIGAEKQLDICIILDGWSRASQTMKDYLTTLFPPLEPKASEPVCLNNAFGSVTCTLSNWLIPLEPGGVEYEMQLAKSNELDEKLPLTVVIARYSGDQQRRLFVTVFHPYDENRLPVGELLLTLIVKKDNRRKHNSHIWFLSPNGFAPSTGAELYFLTDGGTMFESGCIRSLIRYMEDHPSCGVVTGRQRVMTAKQQALPESWISWMSLYRAAIMYDYEAGFASFVGAFALFGFLPVVPGPCGLYRREMLQGPPLDNYFEILQQSPHQTGLVLGNLRLAEDRVLSYAPMIWGDPLENHVYMGVEPSATFLFQQEEGLENLVAQRRRWINGTVAGYIWLLANIKLIIHSSRMAWYTKLFTLLLSLFQMILYIEVALSPMIFLLPLRHLFVDYLGIRISDSSLPTSFFVEIIWWCCVALWIVFVLRHAAWSKYEAWMFLILGILGAVGLFSGIVSLIVFMNTSEWKLIINNSTNITTVTNATVTVHQSTIDDTGLIQLIGIGFMVVVFLLPFVNAILYSPKSFLLMVLTLIPFWFFLPTLVVWFGAYAFSRFWDLNWGNRPSDQMDEIGNATLREATQRSLKQESYAITAFIVLLNFCYALLYELQSARPIVITATIILLFFSTFVQLIFSFIFALNYNIRRMFRTSNCSRKTPQPIISSSNSQTRSSSSNLDRQDV